MRRLLDWVRPLRSVTLCVTDNSGKSSFVTLRPGDTLDINHTINDKGEHPHVQFEIKSRACTVEIA